MTKSQYVSNYPVLLPKPLILPLAISVNASTLDLGKANIRHSGNIEFTYMFSQYPYPVPGGIVQGLGTLFGGAPTAWNTLILAPDCRRVITSFPGLPKQQEHHENYSSLYYCCMFVKPRAKKIVVII
jgi:hypothetical protein